MANVTAMQVDPSVELQEANMREEFLKRRVLFLAQSMATATVEKERLLEKIKELEAQIFDLRERAE